MKNSDNLPKQEPIEVVAMQRIVLSDEDAEHIKDWQRLTHDEKEALNKLAKILGDENKRKSFYTLLEAQTKISELVAISAHMSWLGGMFMKAGAIAGVLIAIMTAYKVYFLGK